MAAAKQQTELLLREESFLKDLRAKLTDQLNRLKVEEVALLKLIPLDTPRQISTVQHFARQNPNVNMTHDSPAIREQPEESSVNLTPLMGLQPSTGCYDPASDEEEEEENFEEQDDTEDQFTGSLMNQTGDPDFAVPRHLLQQVLQEQLADEDESDVES